MRTSGNFQQKEPPATVLFTGGGTGGHVYPGIAVFRAFSTLAARDRAIRVIWIGSSRGMERRIIESQGLCFIGIPSGKLRRYFSLSNVLDVFKVVAGIVVAFFIMKRYRPRALFSKGGYVSVPPVIGARLAKVPVITHESDFDPGLATRINARFSSIVALSYEQTRSFFQEEYQSRIRVTGNPVRHEVLAGDKERGRSVLSFEQAKPLLLVLGGSQGAREINRLLWSCLERLLDKWNVAHQTGSDGGGGGAEADGGYRRYEYIDDDYGDILAAADLVLCRAGATTLWELAASKKPSILLPLGEGASRGDQIRNADVFEKLGASLILRDGGDELLELTGRLNASPETLLEMGSKAGCVFKPNAAREIAEELFRLGFGEERHEC